VFQSYALWPHMTVAQNIGYGLRLRGAGRSAIAERVEQMLAMLRLTGLGARKVTELSGGQRQRVALGRALAISPQILLLDEPLSNLDAQLRIAMRAELGELRRRLGFTAIYVTHDQEEAFALSDRIIVMRAGRVEQEGTPAELHQAPRTRFVASFLGMKNILEAEIRPLSGGDGLAEARLAAEIVLRARDPHANGAAAGAAAIGFRPVDVRLEAGTAGAGTAGVVIRSLFLGDIAQYHIRSGPIEICAHDHPRAELTEGTPVSWRVDPEKCLVLRE
jgi:ABC-type Fe3+/spermidine/putrescine transport system ATPase subunit